MENKYLEKATMLKLANWKTIGMVLVTSKKNHLNVCIFINIDFKLDTKWKTNRFIP